MQVDGSLLGEDFTLYIAAAWGLSAILMAALAVWAGSRFRSISRKIDDE